MCQFQSSNTCQSLFWSFLHVRDLRQELDHSAVQTFKTLNVTRTICASLNALAGEPVNAVMHLPEELPFASWTALNSLLLLVVSTIAPIMKKTSFGCRTASYLSLKHLSGNWGTGIPPSLSKPCCSEAFGRCRVFSNAAMSLTFPNHVHKCTKNLRI